MRKIAFNELDDDTKKLMIFESSEGVFLFGYNCIQDDSSIWDSWFRTIDEVEKYCLSNYNIKPTDWIEISNTIDNCQHDFIIPTRIKGLEQGKPNLNQFQRLINGKWVDLDKSEFNIDFSGLTGDEKLFICGLKDELDRSNQINLSNAHKILKALDINITDILKKATANIG